MTHRGPFQPLPFCDSVKAGRGAANWDPLRPKQPQREGGARTGREDKEGER